MTTYSAFKRNELNANSNGGSELTTSGLQKVLETSPVSKDLLDKFQFITSRVRDLNEDKIRVLHLHDLANDPESRHLADVNKRNRFHKLVFSSNWQYQQFRDVLGVPFDIKSTVIETGIDTFKPIFKPKKFDGPIRLIYTSTPHRGLNILCSVFDQLSKEYPNIELDVYSSFKIYGWDERDKDFEPLYEFCRNHPKINYHSFQPQEVVREALVNAHILAYPNTWPETSCRSLIEAMMAGLLCVHPNHAALPDTAGGMTYMYDYDSNPNVHANYFYANLKRAVEVVESAQNHLDFVAEYAERRFSWDYIGPRWVQLVYSLNEQYKEADLSFPKQMFSYRTE